MPSDKARIALVDMRDAIVAAQQFIEALTFEQFAGSKLHVFAATRALEIVSEASRRLPPELLAKYPALPWRKVAGAGNVYRHDYQDIQESMIWSAVRNDLPPLLRVVEIELDTFSGD